MPFRHFVEVDKQLFVARTKIYTLGEEHRGIAVGVERQHTLVHVAGITIGGGFVDNPLEKW